MPFLEMSYINIKQKDIHKILVIFQLFTNLMVNIYSELKSWSKFIQSTESLSSMYKTKAQNPKLTNIVKAKNPLRFVFRLPNLKS